MSTRGPKKITYLPGEENKKEWSKLGDDVKKWKIKKGAKFDFNFVEMAARLKAAGFSNKDLAYVFNVTNSTLISWQERYPQFKAACQEGKDLATKYLVAQGLRAAAGYQYEDANEKWIPVYDKENNPVFEENEDGELVQKYNLKERSVFKKHQAANPQLLIFMLANLDPDNWQSVHKIHVDKNERINIQIDGKVVSKQIDALAGELPSVKRIESKEVEVVDETNKD